MRVGRDEDFRLLARKIRCKFVHRLVLQCFKVVASHRRLVAQPRVLDRARHFALGLDALLPEIVALGTLAFPLRQLCFEVFALHAQAQA